MRTIHKYSLQIRDVQQVSLPKGSNILSIQIQRGRPQLWVEVSTPNEAVQSELVNVNIQCYGTGHKLRHEATDNWSFIDTVQLDEGHLIFHFYAQLIDGNVQHANP